MYYCTFLNTFGDAGKYIAFILIGGFLIFIGMYLLSDTADAYLSPCLEFITERLSCNESLAGVTLLAFGNGAPDVFGSIAAAGDPDADSTLDAN
jgi:sodium/potassium/calcium exchanger 6